jgi:NAD+-dependent secondary alcohol dehydrogenase Adh1
MKAARLTAYGAPLDLIDRPPPQIARPDQVLLRVGGAGVCATDLHAIDGEMEPAGVTLPCQLGHENAGWVAEVGELVSTVAVGDPVIVYPPYSCGLCPACRRGDDMHCEHHQFTGLTVDGGFAEQLLVFERQLVALPSGMEPAAVAPHADAGLTAYHAVRRAAGRLTPSTTAVVIGIGGVGHVAVQLVRELCACRIIAVDPDPRRRTLALELGAADAVDGGAAAVEAVADLTGGRGADVVFDFVGSDATLRDAPALLAQTGAYSLVGFGGMIEVPSIALVARELSLHSNLVGSWTDLYELIALHATGRIALRVETHPLDAINEVLERLRGGDIIGRAVLVP